VQARLDVMEDDTKRMRAGRPYVFTDLLRRKGVAEVVSFIETAGGLAAMEAATLNHRGAETQRFTEKSD
jgi:urease accessory protein